MRSRLVGLLVLACCVSLDTRIIAQENTAELRGRVVDSQDAGIPGVTILVTNEATGVYRQASAPPTARTSSRRSLPASTRSKRSCPASQKYSRKGVRLDLGRTDDAGDAAQARRRHRDDHCHGRDTARRSDLEGDWRQRDQPRGGDAAVGERQLHRHGGAAAGRHLQHQHRVVRLGRGQRQRAGFAQQQLHARRRQQQRRRDRAAGRLAGANAGRGRRRVPGRHQPVRRRVRPHDRRDHQRDQQERHERVSWRRRGALAGRGPDESRTSSSSRTG